MLYIRLCTCLQFTFGSLSEPCYNNLIFQKKENGKRRKEDYNSARKNKDRKVSSYLVSGAICFMQLYVSTHLYASQLILLCLFGM